MGTYNNMPKYTAKDIVDKEGNPTEPTVTANGMHAGYVRTPAGIRFRIIGAAPGPANLVKRRRSAKKKYTKNIKALSAMRAFNRHYKTSKKYKTEKARHAAKTRDLCWGNQTMDKTARYRRSPQNYDYEGVDDGSRCPGGPRV